MKVLWLALPMSIGVFALACGEPEAKRGLQIDPIDSKRPDVGQTRAAPEAAPENASDAGIAEVPSKQATEAVNDCQSALDLGSLNGERKAIGEAAETFAAQGHCSKWLKVRVTEASSGLSALAINATLNSPSSTKFDLHAYVNKDKDESACGTQASSSATTLSNVDEINLTWGDDGWWSSDDSRTVILEVRSANGACDASSTWSLVVRTTTSTN